MWILDIGYLHLKSILLQKESLFWTLCTAGTHNPYLQSAIKPWKYAGRIKWLKPEQKHIIRIYKCFFLTLCYLSLSVKVCFAINCKCHKIKANKSGITLGCTLCLTSTTLAREELEKIRSSHKDQYLFHASIVPLAVYNLLLQRLSFDLLWLHKGVLGYVWFIWRQMMPMGCMLQSERQHGVIFSADLSRVHLWHSRGQMFSGTVHSVSLQSHSAAQHTFTAL